MLVVSKIYYRVLLVFLFLIVPVHSVTVFAENSITIVEENQMNMKNGGEEELVDLTTDIQLFPYLLKVAFFLLLIGVMIYILVRFISSQSRQSATGLPIRLLGGIVLGQNRAVQVVQVGKKILILGVGNDVQLIKEINDEDEIEDWISRETGAPLGSIFTRWKKKRQTDQNVSFDSVFEKQILQMRESRERAGQTFLHGIEYKEGKSDED